MTERQFAQGHHPWWRRKKDDPIRIYFEFANARQALQHARGRADDNGWPRSETWYRSAAADLRRAERIYAEKRARWEAVGCPDRTGRKHGKPSPEETHP